MSRSPVAVSTAPEPKNRSDLKRLVVEDVEERRGHGERRGGGHGVGRKGERETDADEDDADILDGVVGEETFQVMLHQGVQYTEQAGDAGERDDDDAPPPGRWAIEIEDDADGAVDCDLGHDAAHQGGDVAWGRRMGERKPDMERHKTGLRTGADKHQDEDEAGQRGARFAHLVEGIAGRTTGEKAEGEEKARACRS